MTGPISRTMLRFNAFDTAILKAEGIEALLKSAVPARR